MKVTLFLLLVGTSVAIRTNTDKITLTTTARNDVREFTVSAAVSEPSWCGDVDSSSGHFDIPEGVTSIPDRAFNASPANPPPARVCVPLTHHRRHH